MLVCHPVNVSSSVSCYILLKATRLVSELNETQGYKTAEISLIHKNYLRGK